MSLRSRLASFRTIHWVFTGLAMIAVLIVAAGAVLVWILADAFDTDKKLSDFESPAQGRAFVSAHLPLPLPADSDVIELSYERWTDWNLTAKVRLASPAATRDYLERVRSARKLNDDYCGAGEPSGAARFFLADVSACGTVSSAADTLSVRCYTR
jgi:hypothetical protein